MDCTRWRSLFQQWLVDSLDTERADAERADAEHADADRAEVALPSELAEHAASCAECGARLEAARSVLRPARIAVEPPSNLQSRVTERLATETATSRRRVFHVHRRAAGGDSAPGRRVSQFAAAAAVVAVAVVFGLFIGRGISHPDASRRADAAAGEAAAGEAATDVPADASVRTVRVEFRLEAPGADHVAVVGDWNEWDRTADPLEYRGDGIWEAVVTLRPGAEYQYQFLVDEQQWVPDPSAPLNVDDGFGGTNSVVNI